MTDNFGQRMVWHLARLCSVYVLLLNWIKLMFQSLSFNLRCVILRIMPKSRVWSDQKHTHTHKHKQLPVRPAFPEPVLRKHCQHNKQKLSNCARVKRYILLQSLLLYVKHRNDRISIHRLSVSSYLVWFSNQFCIFWLSFSLSRSLSYIFSSTKFFLSSHGPRSSSASLQSRQFFHYTFGCRKLREQKLPLRPDNI